MTTRFNKPKGKELETVMELINQPTGFTFIDSIVDRGDGQLDKSAKLFKNGRLIMTSTRANLLPNSNGTSVILKPEEIDSDPGMKAIEDDAIKELSDSNFIIIHAESYGRFLKAVREYGLSIGNVAMYEFFKKYRDPITKVGGLK